MHRLPSIIILGVALIALVALSLLPWADISGGKLKNFNLLSDLMPVSEAVLPQGMDDNIDPELKKIVEAQPDTVRAAEIDTISEADSCRAEIKEIPKDFVAPRIDGCVAIEDYSADGSALARLRAILDEARLRNVRIAMVGDSYIEGDILAQDIRAGLQSRYGGRGVGYVAAFSSFPGFRASVNQASSGWKEQEIRKMKDDDPLRTVLGTYFTAQDGAESHFRKSAKPEHLDFWERTRVVFKADNAGTATFSSPSFIDTVIAIEASPQLQTIHIDHAVSDIKFTTTVSGLKVLGFWLEGSKGIVLDDISLRGNSGVSHRVLNESATSQMREYIDYDLIILEFGMNALSAQQTDYSAYGNAMVKVVDNLKSLYPHAQVLILGIGDRGYKQNANVVSMPTIGALIRVQRNVAQRTGSLFWDTREAMGGNGAAVAWHSDKLLNSDYIHLNHKGGKKLAEIFLQSLDISLK